MLNLVLQCQEGQCSLMQPWRLLDRREDSVNPSLATIQLDKTAIMNNYYLNLSVNITGSEGQYFLNRPIDTTGSHST